MSWVAVSSTGMVTQAGNGTQVPDFSLAPNPPFATHLVDSEFSAIELAQCYMVEGQPVMRPAAPMVAVNESEVTVANCPQGTDVSVFDKIGVEPLPVVVTTSPDQTVVFSLMDAGEYRVIVTPPEPYLIRQVEVTI